MSCHRLPIRRGIEARNALAVANLRLVRWCVNGMRIGLTRERVRQIEKEALERLREAMTVR